MQPKDLTDGLSQFDLGMNSGVAPPLLPKNQLAFSANATVRGTYVKPRPPWLTYSLDFNGDTVVQTAFLNGLWQGGCFYKPDTGPETLVVAISGRLFQLVPDHATRTSTVAEVTGAPGNQQSATAPQEWLWQAEKWVIWNDGINLPVFFDGTTCTRSLGNQTTTVTLFLALPVTVTTVGASYVATFTLPYGGAIGDSMVFLAGTTFATNAIVTGIAGNTVTFTLLSPTPFGVPETFGANIMVTFYPANPPSELPPGKMGVYGKGRNWMCLPDGRSYIASDIVGGPSGTVANDFRDAVLHVTENTYLVGGGVFRIPLSGGEIRAMIFATTLDASLGQGPLQVFTPTTVFSCDAPVDRLLWQSITNPILTESLIGAGGLGQNNTVNFNGDTLFRSLLGVSSLILGRRDVDTWGQVPISREMERVIDRDAENLLTYGSAVIFDNRLLMTCAPTTSALGVYHGGLMAINADPLSSMQGKKPSCWDGLWPGLNAFQLITGNFGLVNRCYAFGLNLQSKTIVLVEVLGGKTDEIYDDSTNRIQWTIESPVLFQDPVNTKREFKGLENGEIYVDQMQGTVHFDVFYKQDDYPCWTPWLSWDECAPMSDTDAKPQYRPRMGLGTPSAIPCDASTNRPMREGYYFQVRTVITGQCRFKGGRFFAKTLPEPKYAPPTCKPLCT